METFLHDLKILHEAQMKRLLNNWGPSKVEQVTRKLQESKLTSQDITVSVSLELQRISRIQ